MLDNGKINTDLIFPRLSKAEFEYIHSDKDEVVVDNNGIDKEITEYKPTHVFIEGLWVVPEKFDVLKNDISCFFNKTQTSKETTKKNIPNN